MTKDNKIYMKSVTDHDNESVRGRLVVYPFSIFGQNLQTLHFILTQYSHYVLVCVCGEA